MITINANVMHKPVGQHISLKVLIFMLFLKFGHITFCSVKLLFKTNFYQTNECIRIIWMYGWSDCGWTVSD